MLKIHHRYFVIALFVFSITVTNIQTFAVEEIWEDYENMGDMVKDIRNGDKDDDKVDYNKFKNSTVYKNAMEDVRNCIDLANKVGEKLGDYEIVRCFENTNYYKEKYVDDDRQNTQQVNRQDAENQNITESKTPSDADLQEEENQNITESKTPSDADLQEQEQKQNDVEKSTSNTSTSKDVRGNNLINELLKTGKFTEDEAKEFVIQNLLKKSNVTSTSNDTSTNDTKSNSTDKQLDEQEQKEVKKPNQNQTKPQIMANVTKIQTSESDSNSTEGCDSSYPEICITTYSAKLICADIPFRNFKVLLPDTHGFDSDADGIGCEE
jgi:polyhydroxyalkanoate synthesis regulator phasin